jgi:DeoR/GlpR family transcriptional regulator of sugar metabolism
MSKTLIPAQRRERIQEYLTIHKIVPSSDLSGLLEVSEATIRRDLEWMESEGILTRTHGGAILNQRLQLEAAYQQRAQRNVEEKRLIGALAASLIEDGDMVFINSGSTTTQLIRHIRGGTGITVITNNLIAALEVGDVGFEIVLVGGSFQPMSNATAGRFANENISSLYANKVFIGVDGITLKHGFTVPADAEADLVRIMIDRTNGPVTVLADHSKWGVVSNYQIARFDQVHRLVVDDIFPTSGREALADRKIEILVAGPHLR